MGRVLGGFQYLVARLLTRRLLKRRGYGKWEYTSAETEIAEARFEKMETYIRRNQNTYVQYIATRSLMDLCEATEKKQGA